MIYKDLSADRLIEHLLNGWQPAHSGVAQELVRRLGGCLQATTETKEIGENTLSFSAELAGICLRYMDPLSCLILGAVDPQTVRASCDKLKPNLVLILALTQASWEQVREEFPRSLFLLFSVDQTRQLLKASNPRQYFHKLLLQQISRGRLNPYNIFLPAVGNMFFGRKRALDRLQEEDHMSFAIAGPGRMGKTSMITQYKKRLTQTKDPMGPLTDRIINFYDCRDYSPDGVARFFATKIDSSRWSDRMTADQLVNFLCYQHNCRGGPLNLLLDEVDAVCQNEAFNMIVSAARAQYCRLVLCGRGVLLKTMLDSKSPLQSRLELIQLEPLDEQAARELLLKPLTDLGFKLESEAAIIEPLLALTGRLPHLLQFYGEKLVEQAVKEETDTISLELLELVKADHQVMDYSLNPLFDIRDPEAHTIGWSLLKSRRQDFSIPDVQMVAAQAGLKLDYRRIREICNDLMINNVLVWQNGTFRMANEGLYFYAKKMKLLESAPG